MRPQFRPIATVTLVVALTLAAALAAHRARRPSTTHAQPAATNLPAEQLPVQDLTADGVPFTVVRVDLRAHDLALFWRRRPDGSRLGTFAALADDLRRRGHPLLFATNAGIFDPNFAPCGLHVEAGRELVPLNRRDGDGNFYLKPNGVFLVDAAGARVIDAARYPGTTADVRLATQSGPLLVCAGVIHPRFDPRSPNRRLRSAVAVASPHDVCFVLSRAPVTFHALATFCRDRLACPNALYLDGVISRFYWPGKTSTTAATAAEFAGILAVTGTE